MQRGAEIDYESYAKSMRGVLSGPQICLPDKSLNHQYFNAKKGFYWSQDSEAKLVQGIKLHGKDWKKISTDQFNSTKSEVELEMRACILYKVKDDSQINQKMIQEVQKKIKTSTNNPEATTTTQGRSNSKGHKKG